MINKDMGNIVFLVVISERKKRNAILVALLDAGVHLINTTYGKGSYNSNYLTNTLGLVSEKNKAMITCVSTYAKADSVLNMLVEKFNFDKPHTGIAFTVPVDQVSF